MDPAIAIITGASSGIGRETALRLARRGMRTVLVARRTPRLETLAEQLRQHAPSEAATLDLASPGAAGAWLTGWVAANGPVRVLVNNAGVGQYTPYLEQSADDHRRVMNVNYFAPAELIRAALPGMLQQGKGHVINVCSITTRMATWGHAAYCASKSALLALSQTLEAEHGADGVRFSCVNPGLVKTEFFDDPRYAPLARQLDKHGVAPERVAKTIEALIDRPRLEVSVPGFYRVIDLLRAASPRATHRLFAGASRATAGNGEASPAPADTPSASADP